MTPDAWLLDARHVAWEALPAERLEGGIERRMIWGERVMVCRLCCPPGVVTPEHAHPHEQITLVERGRVRFTIDGRERLATAGDVLHLSANVRHGAAMLDEEVVLVDIFSPVREDLLPTERPGDPR